MNREQRHAENETFFREINERIEDIADDVFDHESSEPKVWEFVCECFRTECTERVPMTILEYETVRADGRRFVVRPEHSDPQIERVVDRSARYWVVEKFGEPGEIAEDEDPRN